MSGLIIPNAKQQYLDGNGNPLAGGFVYYYIPSTTTFKNTYQNAALTILNSNPIILDGAGECIAYGSGSYRQIVTDVNGNLIWDQPTYAFPNDALNVIYTPPFTNGVAETVSAKLSQNVSVKDFGATGDGTTDDTAAIQAAINAFKPADGSTPTIGNFIYFPKGIYLVSSTISTYSGITLYGIGKASTLKQKTGLTGSLFNLASVDGSGQYRYGGIENLNFETTGSVWAIKATANNVLNSTFTNLYFNCGFCVSAATYTQDCIFRNFVSVGYLDQFIYLIGNFNRLEFIDKESNTGSSSDPYILIQGTSVTPSEENSLKNILLEGSGSVNKTPISLIYASGTTLENYHMEASITNGYSITLSNSQVFFLSQCFLSVQAHGKISLLNNSQAFINFYGTSAEDLDWQSYLVFDSSSFVNVNSVQTRRNSSIYQLNNSNQLFINQVVNQTLQNAPVAGYSPVTYPNYIGGQNLLINPSFEAGFYAWGISSADTPSFVASEVGVGLMMQVTSTVGFQLTQLVNISASQVGQPLTIRYLCKVVGSGFAVPIIAGDAQLGYNRVSYGTGWNTITTTFRPSSSGTLNFGLWFAGLSGSSTIYIDEFAVSPGDGAIINPTKFGSFELNASTFTTATAVPSNGTWKRGDRVFNSLPSVGSPKSWVCTVAGTPGTWVSEGNL
jgi:hypothetical protein